MISLFLKEVTKFHIDFRLFRNLHLTNKSGKDHFKALDLWKMAFLGDDKSLVYELILALVSLWLLVDSIKKEKSQRETSDWFFLFILRKDIFDYYIIILPLFGFQRGYGMNERSDFILTEINGYYNSNDRWKFLLFFD